MRNIVLPCSDKIDTLHANKSFDISFPDIQSELYICQHNHASFEFTRIYAVVSLQNDLKRVALEIEALKILNHQNISRLYQVVETHDRFFLILEYAPGGELFDYIVTRSRCKENEARSFFRQIVSAVHYMHGKGYVHRDLKPENLLLDSERVSFLQPGLCFIGHNSSVNFKLIAFELNRTHLL